MDRMDGIFTTVQSGREVIIVVLELVDEGTDERRRNFYAGGISTQEEFL